MLLSGISRITTGESLTYPVRYQKNEDGLYFRVDGIYDNEKHVSMRPYDKIDLWIVTLWEKISGFSVIKPVLIVFLGTIVAVLRILNKKIQWELNK